MTRNGCLFVILCLLFTAFPFAGSFAADTEYSVKPTLKAGGKKWRIAYYQGGPYVDYQTILKAVIRGLAKIGWVETKEPPKFSDPQNTEVLWQWMISDLKSDYLEFVPNAYYDSNWDKDTRMVTRSQAIERVNAQKDIDLIFAFGTWAGQDLANNEHSIPIEVISASDPLGAGIVKSLEDSGFDHVHAKLEPRRYEIQVELFHDIIGFQKLGVVYEDTVEGRTYAAVDKIDTVAKSRGFEVVRCLAQFSGVSEEEATANVMECHNKLAPQIDALYITVHRGVNTKTLPQLLDPIYQRKIPTFSQSGPNEVRHGVLLSIAQAEFQYAGEFHAENIAKVLNGAKPRELTQEFESPKKIAINFAVAEIISYDPPVDILAAADEIYTEIEKQN